MFQYLYLLLFVFLKNLWLSESAKILAISLIMSKSHSIIHQAILKGLASKGHEIVSISYFKSDTNLTNYQDIVLTPTDYGTDYVDTLNISDTANFGGFWTPFRFSRDVEYHFCSNILQRDYMQKLVKSDLHKFDLLISQMHYTKCYSLLAYKLNVPLVLISPTRTSPGIDNVLGNSFNPAYVPVVFGEYGTKMSLIQRVLNSLHYLCKYWYQFFIHDKELKQLSQKVLNIDYPSDDILHKKIALALCNVHHSFTARPFSPKIKNIAGVHIGESKPLPKDISEFIESSKHGVIFFSFGTMIKANSIPVDKLEAIINVLSTIPQKVLWKAKQLNVTLPPNVRTSEWFPQRDILEHQNVIAFISHCGLLSTFEAIHTATPVLAIPIAYDQKQNTHTLVEKGVAVHLDFETIGEETLSNSIREITRNEKYKNNMLKLSKIFKDCPISPLNEAIYWIEYVIRHTGADHLHLTAAEMPLYQYLLMDVIFFIVLSIAVIIYIGKNIIRVILSFLKYKVKSKIH